MKVEQPKGSIGVLKDLEAEFGDRDDAAMDLGKYDSTEVFEALLFVATNPKEDPQLQDSCGESLAEICSRRTVLEVSRLTRLALPAREVFLATLLHYRPEWKDLLNEFPTES